MDHLQRDVFFFAFFPAPAPPAAAAACVARVSAHLCQRRATNRQSSACPPLAHILHTRTFIINDVCTLCARALSYTPYASCALS